MKRILINATQNEEIRVALCKGNHLYDFDLENRTREQKKSNIYKGHVTRVEPSLEAVFVEYGSQRQGFLPIREISAEYLSGNPRDENIKKLIKEGDELIVQVEKEERGNKGAALSSYVSLAGRYLVLMPNNPRGGGISRQISGKLREDMKRMLGNLDLPKGMSVIIRTAGIGKTQEDLQHDLNHLLNIWQAIQEQNKKYPSPRLVHQEAGVVTRAVRDYLRDDIAEIWIDNENAYVEAAGFIDAVMPTQADKLRKYTDYEPMFARFNIEKQIETAYQREVRLPSGGSIVIDQTEALVSIDINSAKSTKGSDVAETAYHTNLEAADEIARQLRLRDMGGLIVIDFIDMNDNKHQKEVEKRLVDATKYDRARVQFGDISKFGLLEMSRQRLRPSLEESTGYICPRCHGNGMIRDLRSLSLSIMREIEQIALKERQGEVQAEVPTDIAAFLLNEKRDSLVYLEQDSGTRITILPHAHLESPNFKLHFNRDGFAPSSYERITDTQQQEHSGLGYDVDWQTTEKERPEQQPTRQPLKAADSQSNRSNNQQNSRQQNQASGSQDSNNVTHRNDHRNEQTSSTHAAQNSNTQNINAQNAPAAPTPVAAQSTTTEPAAQPQALAWLSNLFSQAPQAQTANSVSSRDAAEAIEALVNTGAQSLGSFGQVDNKALSSTQSASTPPTSQPQPEAGLKNDSQPSDSNANRQQTRRDTDSSTDHDSNTNDDNKGDDRRSRKPRKSRTSKPRQRKDQRDETVHDESNNINSNVDSNNANSSNANSSNANSNDDRPSDNQDKRHHDNKGNNDRSRNNRQDNGRNSSERNDPSHSDSQDSSASDEQTRSKRKPHSQRSSRGKLERNETLTTLTADSNAKQHQPQAASRQASASNKAQTSARRHQNPNEVSLQVNKACAKHKVPEVVHLSLEDSQSEKTAPKPADKQVAKRDLSADDATEHNKGDITAPHSEEKSAAETATNSTSHTPADTAAVSATKDKEPLSTPEVSNASDSHTASQTTDSKPTVNNQQSSAVSVITQEPAVAKTATNSESPDKAESQKSGIGSDIDNAAAVTTEATTNSSEDSNTEDNNAALELTHEALFAKHYVTANKFGQASNDPRVVRRQQPQAPLTVPVTEQTIANAPAIRGTVGEFIRATLPEAQTRLVDSGVIRSFIDAITIHTQHTQTAAVTDADTNKVEASNINNSHFDFSNYGYQPLAADYLTRFEAMTQAVSQFAAAQGKTPVEPRDIRKRASNDPRGQHPDYQAPVITNVPSEPITLPNQKAESGPEDTNAQESSDSVNTDAPHPETMPTDSPVDAHDVEATALTGEMQADDISADSEQLLQVDQVQHQLGVEQTDNESIAEASVADDSHAGKSKTTIASYKNMIENVAEQLLPQSGMFNLTSPKVPKARSRKPKTEHKKPTQAEKIEADSSDNDS